MKIKMYFPLFKGKQNTKEAALEVNVKKNLLTWFFYLSKTFQFKPKLNIGLAWIKDGNFLKNTMQPVLNYPYLQKEPQKQKP